VRRLPSKRYQASHVGPDLVRHAALTTNDTKADAEALSAERLLQRCPSRNSWFFT
jgi:hypothetical protein